MRFRHINTIMNKELRGYFNSPLAYIFITVFLIVSSWFFFQNFFLLGQTTMRAYFSLLPWIFLFLIPAITMKQWAEEEKMGTIEILLTSPITEWEVVLGKFFASLLFLVSSLLLSLVIPVILLFVGNPDLGVIVGGYFGTFFLGAAYLAIGLWVSSMTNNQIIAFIFSVTLMLLFFIIGEDFILHSIHSSLVPVFKYLAIGIHFKNIARGIFDSRDIIYYVILVGFFLYLNVARLKSQRLN